MNETTELILSTYNAQATKLSAQYQSVNTEDVLAGLKARLPKYRALDIACGNGRDAKWMAGQGFIVDAIDGAEGMIRQANAQNPHSNVNYAVDLMPDLSYIRSKVKEAGAKYDLITMSAAWMHLDTDARARMFQTLQDVANPGAVMFITLRHGPAPADRPMFAVTADELRDMCESNLMHFEHIIDGKADQLGRGDVWWDSACLKMPENHIEALPLYRDSIINSPKNTSYKLGFTHCLLDLIRNKSGLVQQIDDARYSVPLGPMLPQWIRLYDGLADAGLVQIRNNKRLTDPLNATRRFTAVAGGIHANDLTDGKVFEGTGAQIASRMLNAAHAAMIQPARFIIRPDGQHPVFSYVAPKARQDLGRVLISDENLSERFGSVIIAKDIVHAGRDYASLIDAGVVREWARFTGKNSGDHLENVRSRLENVLKAA